eukprot:GAFH01002967.1.p1 GENE.GAFH01002967.1~~GAFH01002967.1.p1  ORF type:complete len:259 (-),score=1.39 GAFH01002967.1:109-885(-)
MAASIIRRGFEAQVAANHPNVQTPLLLYEPKGRGVHEVFELCEMGSLADLFTAPPTPLPLNLCWLYIHQLCMALASIHDQHLVHCDISLEKCLLDSSGNLKLTGFYLARREGEPPGDSGSVVYLAPEVTALQKTASPRDIWSAGVILYALLFASFPRSDLHLRDIPQPAAARLSAPLADLLGGMLDPDPQTRLTARGVLAHPWMVSPPCPSADLQAEVRQWVLQHRNSRAASRSSPPPAMRKPSRLVGVSGPSIPILL